MQREGVERRTSGMGVRRKPAKELLRGKAPLLEQDVILVPCNPGTSKHWFLVVLIKEKQIVVDSLAASSKKPSVEEGSEFTRGA